MKVDLPSLHHRAMHRAATWLSTRPDLYYSVRLLSGRMDDLCVNCDTEIVIEGFPRSANSTTVSGFLKRQDRPVRLAHHKHHAAQILRAVDWGIPAVMLIRQPRDAVLSLHALAAERCAREGGRCRGNHLTFADAACAWLVFYRVLLPRLDQVVIAPFEDVTHDLTPMIKRVNSRWESDFQSAPNVESEEEPLGWHARPNDLRRSLKNDLEIAFEAAVASQESLRVLISACEEVYRKIMDAQ